MAIRTTGWQVVSSVSRLGRMLPMCYVCPSSSWPAAVHNTLGKDRAGKRRLGGATDEEPTRHAHITLLLPPSAAATAAATTSTAAAAAAVCTRPTAARRFFRCAVPLQQQ